MQVGRLKSQTMHVIIYSYIVTNSSNGILATQKGNSCEYGNFQNHKFDIIVQIMGALPEHATRALALNLNGESHLAPNLYTPATPTTAIKQQELHTQYIQHTQLHCVFLTSRDSS